MLKKLFCISIVTFIVIGLLVFGSPAIKASADPVDNLAKASVGITASSTKKCNAW